LQAQGHWPGARAPIVGRRRPAYGHREARPYAQREARRGRGGPAVLGAGQQLRGRRPFALSATGSTDHRATTNQPTDEEQEPMTLPPAATGKPLPKGSRFGHPKAGRIRNSRRMGVIGPKGVGKTGVIVNAPGLYLFDIEDGANSYDVPRYMFRDDKLGHVPR